MPQFPSLHTESQDVRSHSVQPPPHTTKKTEAQGGQGACPEPTVGRLEPRAQLLPFTSSKLHLDKVPSSPTFCSHTDLSSNLGWSVSK
jgi:hypothetical protein